MLSHKAGVVAAASTIAITLIQNGMSASCNNMISKYDTGSGQGCGKLGQSNCSYVAYDGTCEHCSLTFYWNCYSDESYEVTATVMMYGDCVGDKYDATTWTCIDGLPDPAIPPYKVTCYYTSSVKC